MTLNGRSTLSPNQLSFSSQNFQFVAYFFEASILLLKFGRFRTCLHNNNNNNNNSVYDILAQPGRIFFLAGLFPGLLAGWALDRY